MNFKKWLFDGKHVIWTEILRQTVHYMSMVKGTVSRDFQTICYKSKKLKLNTVHKAFTVSAYSQRLCGQANFELYNRLSLEKRKSQNRLSLCIFGPGRVQWTKKLG